MFHANSKYMFFCTTLLSFALSSQAQKSKLETISFNPIGGLSGKYSLVQGKPNRISGVYAGNTFGERHKAWVGYYWTNVPIVENLTDPRRPQLGFIASKEGRMSYLSFAYEYTFLKQGNWKLSAPVQLGFGKVKETYISKIDKKIYQVDKTPVLPLEFGVNAQYLFFEWLGIKAGLGTRIAIGNGTSAIYSGPFSSVGILFYFEPLYKKLPASWQIIPEIPKK